MCVIICCDLFCISDWQTTYSGAFVSLIVSLVISERDETDLIRQRSGPDFWMIFDLIRIKFNESKGNNIKTNNKNSIRASFRITFIK